MKGVKKRELFKVILELVSSMPARRCCGGDNVVSVTPEAFDVIEAALLPNLRFTSIHHPGSILLRDRVLVKDLR